MKKIKFYTIAIIILFVCVSIYFAQPERDTSKKWPDKRDPIENDPRYKTVFANIDSEVDKALKNHPYQKTLGFIHVFWAEKKKILKKKYGIDWKSPAEMNPYVQYD